MEEKLFFLNKRFVNRKYQKVSYLSAWHCFLSFWLLTSFVQQRWVKNETLFAYQNFHIRTFISGGKNVREVIVFCLIDMRCQHTLFSSVYSIFFPVSSVGTFQRLYLEFPPSLALTSCYCFLLWESSLPSCHVACYVGDHLIK